MRHGALVKLISVYQNNDLYDTQVRIFMLQNPFLKPKSRKVEKLYTKPRYTDIEANLRYFKKRYENILKQEEPASTGKLLERRDYGKLYRAYYQYIQRQHEDVNEKLRLLDQLPEMVAFSRPQLKSGNPQKMPRRGESLP